jgi:hypothetical protein
MKIWKILVTTSLILWTIPFYIFAVNEGTPNNLHIIPEASSDNDYDDKATMIVEYVWNGKEKWNVIDRYNEYAKDIADDWDLWMAFKTWVMSRDTLLSYVVYLMRFLNQLGILIWAVMILYAWYQFAWTIFNYWTPSKGKTAIKNAIIWMLVIIFSYAIWAGLEAMFL